MEPPLHFCPQIYRRKPVHYLSDSYAPCVRLSDLDRA